jgi:hypothetical protein
MNRKKKTIWMGVVAVAMALTFVVPQLAAAEGDSITFTMIASPGATCLPSAARGRVTVSDRGPVQNLHLEVFGLTPNTSFTTFITQHGSRPLGFSWYQGEIETNAGGTGAADYVGIFSEETFLLTDSDSPIQMDHMGMRFADPADAVKAGCPGIVTPFDGDHKAGILVLSTANFPDDHGPLLQLKESEGPTAQQ